MAAKHGLPEALAAPGVIMRLTLNLGEQDCALQMEGFLDRDASQDEYDALARKLVKTAEKERALRLIPGYKRQLENLEYLTGENKKKLKELEARLAEGKRQRDEKILDFNTKKAAIESAARDEHYNSGRRGQFKPTGSAGTDLNRIQAQINQLMEAQIKEEDESEIQRATLENEIKDGARRIFQAEVLIEECEKLARGEDIVGLAQ